jgi:hypothetical protein
MTNANDSTIITHSLRASARHPVSTSATVVLVTVTLLLLRISLQESGWRYIKGAAYTRVVEFQVTTHG